MKPKSHKPLSQGIAVLMVVALLTGWLPGAAFSVQAASNHIPVAYQVQPVLLAAPGGKTTGLCESWLNACELQYALTSAVSGQQLWVAAGTYKPTTGTDRNATFQLKNGVAVYGGFAGTETALGERNPAVNITLLSGDLNGDDVGFTNSAENVYHVVTGASGATLDGFTVTAGNADGRDPNNTGGGMYNPLDSSPVVTNVIFRGNQAIVGGGMENYYGHPTLTNVTFSGNVANMGGGMDNNFSHPTLTNVTFSGNSASYGGGMYNNSGTPTLTNVTFSNNAASYKGGGMENDSYSYPMIRNTIFWGNTAVTESAAQMFNDSSTPVLSHSAVQGGCPTGSTCTAIITADPLLGTLGNYGGFTQTISLSPGSPAIDAGDDAICPAADQRGMARPQGLHCDIGSYEALDVDVTAPMITSMTRVHADPTNLASVDFAVTFSESVSGVDITDFVLTIGGPISGASITGVNGSGQAYIVSVNTGAGDGTLRLDLKDDDSIKDAALNPLGGTGTSDGTFTEGEVYTLDKSIPAVVSIVRADPSPTAAGTIHFVVTFSELVSGVDGSDFTLTPTGNITGFGLISWSQVGGQGVNYEVTVNTGTGDGTLRLGIGEDDTIVDATGNPLGGPGIGNGNFEGETYTINKNAPVVISSVRQDQNPTSADVVHFTVIFSEPVTGVDSTDFLVTAFGISGTSILKVSGDGTSFWIDVATGTGNGELRLDVMDNDSILDLVGLQLGGAGLGNANFTTGEAYTISRSVPPPPNMVTETFRSNGTNDGWVLESTENSNVGGTVDAKAKTFNLGDDAQDRQYRAILHFPTGYLPNNAVITRVILMMKSQTVVGTDPFTTHQNVQVDICNCLYGFNTFFGIRSLQPVDFESAIGRDAVGLMSNNPVGGWYWSTLDATAFPYINLTGTTQIRLRFQLDDNDDLGDDYIKFFSGNTDAQGDRPQLMVEYYVQK